MSPASNKEPNILFQ